MKTLLYALLAIFIFGIVATGYTQKTDLKNRILIQSAESDIPLVLLYQSAQIMADRLKDFSSEKFDITPIPEKDQIQVTFSDNQDLQLIESLLTQKGALAFYETYNRSDIKELLTVDDQLYSLIDTSNTGHSAAIGCVFVTGAEEINDYLSSTGIIPDCKFVWNRYADNSDVCLYALRLNSQGGALLTGTDVESITFDQEEASNSYNIKIRFEKSSAEVWSLATKRGLNQAIAIVLDETVIYAPVVRSVIDDGICSITGNFTEAQVRYFAAMGNNDELPVNFEIVE